MLKLVYDARVRSPSSLNLKKPSGAINQNVHFFQKASISDSMICSYDMTIVVDIIVWCIVSDPLTFLSVKSQGVKFEVCSLKWWCICDVEEGPTLRCETAVQSLPTALRDRWGAPG